MRSQISPFCQQWAAALMGGEEEAAGSRDGPPLPEFWLPPTTSTWREVDKRRERETENVMRAVLMHYSSRGGHFTKKYRNTGQIFDKAGLQSCTLLSQRSDENSGKEKRQRYGCRPQLKLTASQMK